MSKERLEDIKKQVKRSDEYAEDGMWEASDRAIVQLHNEGHINYLIRRVQELEDRLADDKHFVAEIMEQNKRYRECIEYLLEEAKDHKRKGMRIQHWALIKDLEKALEGEE